MPKLRGDAHFAHEVSSRRRILAHNHSAVQRLGFLDMQFLFMILVVVASVTTTSALKVRITQTNAVIDANPIINLSEIQFFYNGVKQSIVNKYIFFNTSSSGYPAENCNDGVTLPGPFPHNMCKSGNSEPTEFLFIYTGTVAFNQIVIYNAYGFNNPAGFDVGNRIKGATIQIFSDAGAVLHTNTFPTTLFQVVYTFIYPLLTASPSSSPTIGPPTTPKPSTNKPSGPTYQPFYFRIKSEPRVAATDDLALLVTDDLQPSDELPPSFNGELSGQTPSE